MKKFIYCIIIIIVLVSFFKIWEMINLRQKQVAVLVYHNIVQTDEKKLKDQDTLTVEEFEEQIKYLIENEYTSLSLDEFYDWKKGKKEIPKKSVVITFDDGFYSFKYLAKPILEKYNFKACCFLIGKVTMPNTPQYLKEAYGTIGLDEVKNKSENIMYGSHTFYLHEQSENGIPIVKYKSYEEIKEDTEKFRKELFDAKYLAYPYYTYTSDFIKVLKEENYKLAFAGEEEMVIKNSDDYSVPRISGVRSINDFKEIFESDMYKNRYGSGLVRKIIVTIKRKIKLLTN